MEINAKCVLSGQAEGPILFTRRPISFWGCVDPATGRVIDKRHDLLGRSVAGKILVFPFGKGSCTGSLMILELLRLNLGPAAIVNIRTEPLLATGPVVGRHFYGKWFPLVNVDEKSFDALGSGAFARIDSAPDHAVIRLTRKPAKGENT